jgi:hypothetical protein
LVKATKIQKKKLRAKVVKEINKRTIKKYESPIGESLKTSAGLELLSEMKNRDDFDRLISDHPEVKSIIFDHLYLQNSVLAERSNSSNGSILEHLASVFQNIGLFSFSKAISEASSKLSSSNEYMAAMKSYSHSDYASTDKCNDEDEYLTQLKEWAIAIFSADFIERKKNGTDRRPRTKPRIALEQGEILSVDRWLLNLALEDEKIREPNNLETPKLEDGSNHGSPECPSDVTVKLTANLFYQLLKGLKSPSV